MANRLAFADFWSALEKRTDPLFVDAREDIDGLSFKRASLAVAAQVRGRGWRTVGLHTRDSFAFAASIFGILFAGATPEILPHTQPGLLRELNGALEGLLVDYVLPAACEIPCVEITRDVDGSDLAEPRWPAAPRLGFRTSGSSGAPKRVAKSLDAVEAELTAFEARFGEEMPGTFGGTVDHQHYYGATVRVFWPLLAGRRVIRKLIRHPSHVMSLAPQRLALVTSPSFLVSAVELLRPQDLASANCKIFSAGAPLPLATARRLNAGCAWLLAEIFGSTESGGVCSRIRGRDDDDENAWTALPTVRLSVQDGRIFADWNTAEDSGPVELGDCGERLPDGRLRIFGRRDRIIKVREKRVSLAAIEAQLTSHPCVREVAAVDLRRNELSELGIVVAPSDEGFDVLESSGHRALADRLQEPLRQSFDPTTLPKKWRFVRNLPRDGMAKVTRESLLDLFTKPSDRPEAFPEILSDSGDDVGRTLDLRIGADIRWFRGHFPGAPVLPGVAQIDWAAHFGAPLTRDAGRFERLQRVKFSHPILPGCDVRLVLRYDVGKRSLGFKFSRQERTFSSGHFVYA